MLSRLSARKPTATGPSAGIVKFSDKQKSQGHKRKRQSVNGVVVPVSTTATVLVSAKVVNTCAARNDGDAVQEVSLKRAPAPTSQIDLGSRRAAYRSGTARRLASTRCLPSLACRRAPALRRPRCDRVVVSPGFARIEPVAIGASADVSSPHRSWRAVCATNAEPAIAVARRSATGNRRSRTRSRRQSRGTAPASRPRSCGRGSIDIGLHACELLLLLNVWPYRYRHPAHHQHPLERRSAAARRSPGDC